MYTCILLNPHNSETAGC